MPTLHPTHSARAQFLLSKFKFETITEHLSTGDKLRNFMFFDYQLPPGYTLGQAIDAAISNESFEIFVSETDEVTAEQIHNIKYLFDLFVQVDPIRVEGKTHYHYHIKRAFEARLETQDAAKVIAHAANYIAPTPIFGVVEQSDIYYALTVALRKGCDSPVTSALWNMTQTLDTPTRVWLCEPIINVLRTPDKYPTYEDLQQAVTKACLDHLPTNSKEQAIHCLYRIFKKSDWEGYVSYLVKFKPD